MNLIAREEAIKLSMMSAFYQNDKKVMEKLKEVLAVVQQKKGIDFEEFDPEKEAQKKFSEWMKGIL